MDILTGKPDLESNQAVCFNCKAVLTSNGQYDLVICSCGAMAIDGGNNLRIIELKEDSVRTDYLLASNDFCGLGFEEPENIKAQSSK